jgi:hypothetical protein
MKHLVELPLEDGGSVVMQVEEPEGGMVRAARPGEIVAKTTYTFQQAMERVRPAAEAIGDALVVRLRDLSVPPDEVSVMFGLGLNTEAGVFFASVGTEATFSVTLVWKRSGITRIELVEPTSQPEPPA